MSVGKKQTVSIGFILRMVFLLSLVGFGVILVAPLFFRHKPDLPIAGDPGHVAGAFRFTDQDGKTITAETVKGKVTVVEYFFTTCPSICPRMNENLKTVYENLKEDPDFVILSHTSDPGRDSVPVLKAYAGRLGATAPGWEFLTGKKEELYERASQDYLLSAIDTGASAFVHTEFVALVDRQRRIRGFYDMTQKKNAIRLEADIHRLLKP